MPCLLRSTLWLVVVATAVLVLCWEANPTVGSSPPVVTDYLLQAHGVPSRFSATTPTAQWDVGSNYNWQPNRGWQCQVFTQANSQTVFSSFLIRPEDGAFVIQLMCAMSIGEPMMPILLIASSSTGELSAWNNVSQGFERSFFSSPIVMLPSGDFAFAGSLANETSGLTLVDGNDLSILWSQETCSDSVQCTNFYNFYTPRQLAASSKNDLLFENFYVNSSMGKFCDVSNLGQGDQFECVSHLWSEGALNADGSKLFATPTISTNLLMFELPLTQESTPTVSFPLPSSNSTFSFGFEPSPVSDSRGRVFYLVEKMTGSVLTFVLCASSPSGELLWTFETDIPWTYQSDNTPNIVMTDDETKIIYSVSSQLVGGEWWSSALDSSSGDVLWNITTSTWQGSGNYAPLCSRTPVPLINNTLVYECAWGGQTCLYGVDQETGERLVTSSFSGACIRSNAGTVIGWRYDSSGNIFLCGSSGVPSWNQPYQAWCSKKYLLPCLYSNKYCVFP